MKNTNLRKFTFKDPIYSFETTILIGSQKKTNEFLLKKYNHELDLNNCFDARYFYIEHDYIRLNFIQINTFNWTVDEQGVLAHEIVHLVNNNMAHVGIPLTEETDEAYAYYYSYTFRKVWNYLKQKKL